MKNPTKSTPRDWQTRLRLWAALIMAFYTIASMVFYALGLISAEVMEVYFKALTPVWILYPVYYLAISVHISLGLWKLYQRNTLRMPLWELAQIGFGLLLPFFQLPHLMVTTGLSYFFGGSPNYVDALLMTYPTVAWRFVAVAFIVGVHAHIGAHVVLRMRPWYPRIRWPLVVLLILIPLTGALGYLKGGMDLSEKLQAGTLDQDERPHPLSSEQKAWVMVFDDGNTLTFLGLYVLVFAARAVRLGVQKKKRNIEVVYGDGRKVAVIPHTTVLEASRIGRIPHASICGGRGRCTTCRVKVDQGAENLSPVGDREARALLRIQAPAGVRLACQAECLRGSVTVLPLLVPDTRSTVARKETADTVGRDVQVAVMFADIRGFTRLSEGRFPYDVVYILNRYFEDMGKAIEAHGGVIDKFLGDGILAYFGLDQDPRDACRNAVLAAWDMADRLERVNGPLASVLKEPLSIGIGIQFGEVILGSLGFQANRHLTIIGDTVNTASRFQGLNKKAASQLILSTEVAARAGFDLTDLPLAKTQVRGKTEISRVYVVKDILKDLDRVIKAESRV